MLPRTSPAVLVLAIPFAASFRNVRFSRRSVCKFSATPFSLS